MTTYNFNDSFNQVVKLYSTTPLIEVEYNIREYSKVTLHIINSFGKNILTVVDTYQEAGLHSWKINTSKIKKGNYCFKTSITTSNKGKIYYLNHLEIVPVLTTNNEMNTVDGHLATI